MKSFVKLLTTQEGIRSTPSIYISILLAYLEVLNWEEADEIIHIMQSLELKAEEELVFLYLENIVSRRDQESLEALWAYLKA